MLSGSVTRRYAQALFMASQALGTTTEIDNAMRKVSEAVNSTREARLFFVHPYVSVEQKISVIDSVFSGATPELVKRLLQLLYARKRPQYVAEVYKAFHRMFEDASGRTTVEVESARPLVAQELDEVLHSLETALSRTVSADVKINPSLLAGYRLRIGHRVVDASLRGALNQFSNRLSHIRVVKEGNL